VQAVQLAADPGTGDLTLAILTARLRKAETPLKHPRQASGTWLFETGSLRQPFYRHTRDSLGGMLLVRYTPAGRLQWVKPCEVATSYKFHLAVGDGGTLYLGGESVSLLPGEPDSTRALIAAGEGWVVAGFEAEGQLRWAQRLPPGHQLEALAASPAGVVAAGTYAYGTVSSSDVQSELEAALAPRQLWVRAYQAAGTMQWEQQSMGANSKTLLGLSANPGGQVHLTSKFLPAAPLAVAGISRFGPVELSGIEPVNEALFDGNDISYFWLHLRFIKRAANRP
jgi:hypothetical protein